MSLMMVSSSLRWAGVKALGPAGAAEVAASGAGCGEGAVPWPMAKVVPTSTTAAGPSRASLGAEARRSRSEKVLGCIRVSVDRWRGGAAALSWFLIVHNVFGANPFRRTARQLELSALGENLRLLDVAFDHIGLRGRQQGLRLLALATECGGELAVGQRVVIVAQDGLAQQGDGLVQHLAILAGN